MKNKNLNYYLCKRYDGMMGRCYRESDISYKNYGARGIKVCSDWLKDINNFKTWFMSELGTQGVTEAEFIQNSSSYQLDRINGDGHYAPYNCRILTRQENCRNKKKQVVIEVLSAEGELIKLTA